MTDFKIDAGRTTVQVNGEGLLTVEVDNRLSLCMDTDDQGALQIRVYPITAGESWDNPFVTFDVDIEEIRKLESEMQG